MTEVKLFAFGFTPDTRSASASRLRRFGWTLKRLRQRLYHHHNFGDFLSFLLVSNLSQLRVRLAEQHEEGKLLAIGSILWSLSDQDVIWGSGAHRENQIPRRRIASCVAVRGPLTLQELKAVGAVGHECEPLFFDPAILTPLLYPSLKSIPQSKGKTLLIPHYSDIDRVNDWQKKAGLLLEIVNPFEHPLKVVEKIAQSERVISSSLHGIILADSLGIPAVPLRLEGNREPLFKYVDYYQGTGRSAPRFSADLAEALDRDPKPFRFDAKDLDRFLASFPFPMKAFAH